MLKKVTAMFYRFFKLILAGIVTGFLLPESVTANEQTADLRYFLQGTRPAPSSIPYGNNLTQGKYVLSADARIYYEIYGEGTPVVVLHGGGVGTPFEMGMLIDALSRDFKVFVISSRGHGRSEIGHNRISLEQKASDVYAVLAENHADKAILLGFSDGAYTAYQFAAMFPKNVDRVIAIGAGTLSKGFFSGELKIAQLEEQDTLFVRQQLEIRPEPERWQEFASAYMQFYSQLEVGEELFARIEAPVLLIVGDEDDHAPVKTVLKAHQLLKKSSLCVIPHAWHPVFLDNYPLTYAAIESFIHAPSASLQGSKKLTLND